VSRALKSLGGRAPGGVSSQSMSLLGAGQHDDAFKLARRVALASEAASTGARPGGYLTVCGLGSVWYEMV